MSFDTDEVVEGSRRSRFASCSPGCGPVRQLRFQNRSPPKCTGPVSKTPVFPNLEGDLAGPVLKPELPNRRCGAEHVANRFSLLDRGAARPRSFTRSPRSFRFSPPALHYTRVTTENQSRICTATATTTLCTIIDYRHNLVTQGGREPTALRNFPAHTHSLSW